MVLLVGFLWPERMVIPVRGATTADWNHQTLWYYPWGKSVVHKGIDIFAPGGRAVLAATGGMVLSVGEEPLGGNFIIIAGPKWRAHYYAHLGKTSVSRGTVVQKSQPIATVGTSGNAAGRPPHLHYSIVTLVPYLWRMDSSRHGRRKMFFLDPGKKLLEALGSSFHDTEEAVR